MPLGGRDRVLVAVVDDLDGPARLLPRGVPRARRSRSGTPPCRQKPPPVTAWITRTFSSGSPNGALSALTT
jgi:hypothetical protein